MSPIGASALTPLQTALHARLSSELSTSVYDHVPQGATFPYTVIGEDTAIDWSTKSKHGEDVTCTLHIWSRKKSMSEVKSIADAIQQAVITPLSLTDNWQTVDTTLDMFRTLEEPDGITRHGVLRLRFKLYKKS